MRAELATVRKELDSTRRKVSEIVTGCREAESRVAATRVDADAIRRAVSDVDSSAVAVQGVARVARAEVDHSHATAEQTEERLIQLREWLAEAREEFAALDAESRKTLDRFRTAVAEMRGVPPPTLTEEPPAVTLEPARLPDLLALPPGERADDLHERLVHLLNDAWAVEKEQISLLQTLADECGDRDLRVVLEAHRADSQERQRRVEARLEALGARPTGGRGLLGQFVTRVWDVVQAPRDQADRALLSVLKALNTAEFQAGLYAATYACARFADDAETAELAAAHYREERNRADQLRTAIVPTVGRTARQ